MAVFLSPGVFPREIDLSVLPTQTSGVIPAFIGTAQKGPVNEPTFITSSAQFIDTFGEPFVDSNLGYAVMSYLEEGSSCWVLRVGIEQEDGQDAALAAVAIDTSGTNVEGWGRIPLFQGIDYGKILLRTPTTDEPFVFHAASVDNTTFTDVDVSSTDGETSASLTVVSSAYVGAIDDAFSILITTGPTPSAGIMDGAAYQVIRQSDGEVVSSGTIVESVTPGTSEDIQIGSGADDSGITVNIVIVGTAPLETGDIFTLEAHPDNLNFAFAVEGNDPEVFSLSPATYTDIDTFVTAFEAATGGTLYEAVNDNGSLYIRTTIAGRRIQLVGSESVSEPDTEGFALEVGVSKWVYDIPRSYLIGDNTGPVNISAQRDRVSIDVVGSTETVNAEFSVPVSTSMSISTLASNVHVGGVVDGTRVFEAFALQVTDTTDKLVIATTSNNQFDQVKMLANGSNIETLRFAEEVEIDFPYTRAYRGFSDSRTIAPEEGDVTPSAPLSCETDPGSDECSLDTSYFANIVGYIVAKSPGTWIDSYTLTLENFDGQAARYSILLYENGILVDRVDDISFDSTETRYIGNVVNEGSAIGGQNGNEYYQWEERATFIGAGTVRNPGHLQTVVFSGAANGIPPSAAYSSELDSAVIGSPQLSTGLYAFQNPEAYDISHVVVPGNSSGAVIGQMLQLCESRGDCLAIIDPPFGLRPQQVVDWHNGMLLSDLASAINSSYGALYWGWLKIFDQFSSQEIFVPPSGHALAVHARTERETELWFAPAGLNRGRLLTALDVEYNPSQGERDLLYGFNNAVNPIVKFPQDGITIWGQRTLQRADTALDRINVRMLLIAIKKQLIPLLRNFLFEPNDQFLRNQVRSSVTISLGDFAARRGVTAFKVVCDETNNTPERVDRNELWVSVFVRPTKAAEFIVLNLAVLRSDQSFRLTEVLQAGGVVGA